MASLTPGVLSKLLQTLNNPNAKVSGHHRTPLLQVIAIVPKHDIFDFTNRNNNHRGFYLRVSDSLHSAYVSVPEADVDLILNDKIQLGQFVHVTRFEPGSPVPVVRGIKPVPKRRACVGDPKDLISSDLLVVRAKDTRRLSLSNGKVKVKDDVDTRRLSLDFPARKGWDRSPAVKNRRSGLEVNGSGLKVREPSSPLCSTPDGKSYGPYDIIQYDWVKKSCGPYDVTIKLVYTFGGGVPDYQALNYLTLLQFLLKIPLDFQVRSVRKSSLVKDLVQKQPNMNLAPLKSKNVIVTEKSSSKPIKKDLKTSFDNIHVPNNLTKVQVNARTCPDSKISWDSVSPTIRQLGKEAICHRNLGFSSAIHALKESSAIESILQCMSRFGEICELAETTRNPLVEQFLNFYHDLQTSTTAVNALIDSKSTDVKTKSQPNNSALWVQAALESNLGKFTLFTMEDNRKIQDSEANYHIVLDNASDNHKIQAENRSPGNKKIPRTQESVASRVRRVGSSPVAKNENSERVKWSKGSGLKETAKLAEELLLVSQKWFLNYLEESLNNGFWLTKGEDSAAAVGLLGQLKRVNRWLDESARGDENVENLRKKIYRFLLDHVQKAGT